MKFKNKYKFSYPRTNGYLCVALKKDGKYLILRYVNDNQFEKTGYFFPGCKDYTDYVREELIAKQIEAKYGLDIIVGHFLGDAVAVVDGKRVCLYMYEAVCNSLVFNTAAKITYRFASTSELSQLKLDVPDMYLAQRLQIFDKVYNPTTNLATRTEEEKQLYINQYEALLKLQKFIAKKDLLDFSKLIKSSATKAEINAAFRYIIDRNGISEQQLNKVVK